MNNKPKMHRFEIKIDDELYEKLLQTKRQLHYPTASACFRRAMDILALAIDARKKGHFLCIMDSQGKKIADIIL
jgi:hypothetical protein